MAKSNNTDNFALALGDFLNGMSDVQLSDGDMGEITVTDLNPPRFTVEVLNFTDETTKSFEITVREV